MGAVDSSWSKPIGVSQDEIPEGFEAEHHGCRDYFLTNPQGGRLSPRRVSPEVGEPHSRQATALHRRPYVLHVRSHTPANWLTVSGVNKKRKAIERKGLPSFRNWRFITLTLDPKLFQWCPLSGYLEGKAHMRRFLFKCRKAGLWADDAKWAWKMEFQANGWVHWHLLVEERSKIDTEAVKRIWGLGRTEVQRVNTRSFLYSFKYAFKAVYQQSEGEGDAIGKAVAPRWFLDYEGSKEVRVKAKDATGAVHDFGVAEKPVTFSRVRFWQTSKGFYLQPEDEQPEKKDQVSWTVPLPVRAASERLERTVQVVARGWRGQYIQSTLVELSITQGRLWHLASWHSVNRGAVGLGVGSFCVPPHLIQQNSKLSCRLSKILERNRLRLHQAAILQEQGIHLRTS